MSRRVFFSFHYQPDNWRASQVRNMGVVEGNVPVRDNDWEVIAKGGDAAIRKWINSQMHGRSCIVVLIGNRTAERKWIRYEIEKAWNDGKGLVGIYIHHLKNRASRQALKGKNPFDYFAINGRKLSSVVKAYDPPYKRSRNVYRHIDENIENWVEEAIRIRN